MFNAIVISETKEEICLTIKGKQILTLNKPQTSEQRIELHDIMLNYAYDYILLKGRKSMARELRKLLEIKE